MLIEDWGLELPCADGALQFIAEVLEVFLTYRELQNFINYRREVRQRAYGLEWRRICRSCRTPRRSQYQRIANRDQRHVALIELRCKKAIGTADDARRAGR